ncbi:MAG: hypothetical protein QM677_01685 [Microbacterium sp.]
MSTMISVPAGIADLTLLELRKILSTRGTRWVLIVTVFLSALMGLGAIVLSTVTGSSKTEFAIAAVGLSLSVLLFSPIVAILVVSGDWQSRDVMTLFALVPRRAGVFWSKAIATVVLVVGLLAASLIVALVTTVLVALFSGRQFAWGTGIGTGFGLIVSGALAGTLSGIAIGSALLRPAVAIVVVILANLGVDPALSLLPNGIGSYLQYRAIPNAFAGDATGWMVITSTLLWVIVPGIIGFWRNETKDVQ